MLAILRLLACLSVLVSSALAYTVLIPSDVQGWNDHGPQPLQWVRAETDGLQFTPVLVNQQIADFVPQTLADSVDGTQGTVQCSAPQGGWRAGVGYQLNFLSNASDFNSIIAQSKPFNIAKATTTSAASDSVASPSMKNAAILVTATLLSSVLLPFLSPI